METQKQRVLVTGGAGYIGSVTVRLLLENSYEVTVLDAGLYSYDSLLDVIDQITLIKGDVRNSDDVKKAMTNVDIVVHLAELVGDPACALNPLLARSINYKGSVMVIDEAKKSGVKRLLYTSSCSVYGKTDDSEECSESYPRKPLSLYAEIKCDVENYLQTVSDSTFKPTILRLATVFGLSYRPRFDLVVNTITAIAENESKITIRGGSEWRPLIHVQDVARSIYILVSGPTQLVEGQTYNIGDSSQNVTILDIGNIVHSQIPSAVLETDDQIPSDARSYRVSFLKARNRLAFTSKKSIVDGVSELLVYIRSTSNFNIEKFSNVEILKEIHQTL